MRIINVSNAPYEWTFDGANYGPIFPGGVGDYPTEIAQHAIKRSAIIDDLGEVESYRIESLEDVKKDAAWLAKVAAYPCPFAATAQCSHEPFKKIDDLRIHLEEHWETAAPSALSPGKQEPVLAGKAPATPAKH